MELHGKCCLAEEEVTLTPHHSPSQSFDFIVWEKAYLDSISTDDSSPCISTPTTSKEITQSYHTQSSPLLDHSKSAYVKTSHCLNNDASTLLACKTDADLPSCFLDDKLRLSNGEPAEEPSFKRLTSLEEAVCRSYGEGNISMWRRNMQLFTQDNGALVQHQHTSGNSSDMDCHKEMALLSSGSCEAQDHVEVDSRMSTSVSKALYLRRCMSQPGVQRSKYPHGLSVGANVTAHHDHECQRIISTSLLNFCTCKVHDGGGCPSTKHNHCDVVVDTPPPPRDRAKMSCFPTGLSPGRQRHHIMETPYAGVRPPSKVDMRKKTGTPGPAAAAGLQLHSNFAGFDEDMGHARSLSQNSSPFYYDDDDECHGRNAVLMSKLKWGSSLNHKLRAMWRKLCSSCPQHIVR